MSYEPDSSSVQPAAAPVSKRNGPAPQLIAFAVIAVLAVIFFFQNGEPTYIDFWIFEKRTTIRWSIIMSVVLGIALDRLFATWWSRRRSLKASKRANS